MLLNKDIIVDGHPTLRLKASDVELPLSTETLNILRSMMEYIENSQDDLLAEKYGFRPSVGLAAPQINKSLKMFCMKTLDENFDILHQYTVVNPKIISYSEVLTYLPGGEGCLSVPQETTGLVKRHRKIKARVYLVNLKTGETKEIILRLSGYPAIVFQHEYDHLMGILFIDKIDKLLPNIEPIHFNYDEYDEQEKL
ncbi:MAG: peptide deformylase [Candidatus Izemoplasmatales bacterium]